MIVKIMGSPTPKARPRISRSGHTYTPKKTKEAEEVIKAAWTYPITEKAIRVNLTFVLEIPKSWSKKKRENPGEPTKRPDIDNLVKTVLDALNGVAYVDDSQVISISAQKMYGQNPLTIIEIEEVKQWGTLKSICKDI